MSGSTTKLQQSGIIENHDVVSPQNPPNSLSPKLRKGAKATQSSPTLPNDFHGWWAVSCKSAEEAAKRDVLEGFQIDGMNVNQHENGCSVKKITQSQQTLLVSLNCESEGESHEEKAMLELSSAGKLNISYPEDKTRKHESLTRCGK